MSVSRREFLETTALGGAAASALSGAPAAIPTRVLGRTGVRVTILAFGGGSRYLTIKPDDKAVAALNRALDLGINYVDTAYTYGNGHSEEIIGRVMATRRKEVFLATKITVRKGEEALRGVEESLKRLQTDHLDLLHIHSLNGEKDLAAIEAPDGVLKVFDRLRDQKVTRFIGVTCHTQAATLKTALERHDFDCTQMALNAALMGSSGEKFTPEDSFQTLALPVANRKNLGVIAMKVFAQDRIPGPPPAEQLIRYSMSLPVTAVVIGMPKPEHLEQNVEIAKAFKPMPQDEMRQLSDSLSAAQKAALDRYFARHVDA
jgi:hypothetical protein